ncbi:MAG: hypothetical protein AAGI14_03810 [Pseudomonadota bacterium]
MAIVNRKIDGEWRTLDEETGVYLTYDRFRAGDHIAADQFIFFEDGAEIIRLSCVNKFSELDPATSNGKRYKHDYQAFEARFSSQAKSSEFLDQMKALVEAFGFHFGGERTGRSEEEMLAELIIPTPIRQRIDAWLRNETEWVAPDPNWALQFIGYRSWADKQDFDDDSGIYWCDFLVKYSNKVAFTISLVRRDMWPDGRRKLVTWPDTVFTMSAKNVQKQERLEQGVEISEKLVPDAKDVLLRNHELAVASEAKIWPLR